ncbi:MAG: hypothetical protein ACRD2B_01850 [Terriglobia bacterium]
MLVIISDLHLTDGTSGETVHQGTFRVFRDRLRNLAYAASWRADGRYRPVEELNIVLLGDVLDVLRSSKWLQERGALSRVRPWDDPQSRLLPEKVRSITDGILKNNATFFTMMKELHRATLTSIPPATRAGRPLRVAGGRRRGSRVPVRVRIHYMVGNHDWFFHLPYAPYVEIRRSVVDALGLDNDPALPFPHDPNEPSGGAILEILNGHRVFARHGDVYDRFNFAGHRDVSSLGDAIVIDLVTSFATEVKSQLRGRLPQESLAGLREIDNVRPLLMVPVWVGGLLRRTCPDVRLQRQVHEVWCDLASRFLRESFVRQCVNEECRFLGRQKLRWGLAISGKLLNPESSRFMCWVGGKVRSRKCSYYPFALRETSFKNRCARFIVYGHTHQHELVPLDSCFAVQGMVNQIYLNSGTWRPVHELARYDPSREVFASYRTMTYLAFFKDDERGGRTFECWSGSLSKSNPLERDTDLQTEMGDA